jgi:hypothetical protein
LYITGEAEIFHKLPAHSLKRDKKRDILKRPTFKHVISLQECKGKEFFCGYNILREDVFVTHLVMWESQFDELCGLGQIAVL